MLRAAILRLSRDQRLRQITVGLGPARRLSRRFVAGETLEEAIATATALNRQGILTTLDHLGENVESEAEAHRATEQYIQLLTAIERQKAQSSISVKLTHLGLAFNRELCQENLEKVVSTGQESGNIVEIDMEGSAYTRTTLDLYRGLRSRFDNMLVCVQAYLYRSYNDILNLLPVGPRIRLCKGAYQESAAVAFPQKRDVDHNFRRLLDLIWSEKGRNPGAYVAVATHDQNLIAWAKEEADKRGIPREGFEFQMLHGIRRDLQQRLRKEGFRMRVYVPYGEEWYPYLMRRMAERPANLFFILRNILRT